MSSLFNPFNKFKEKKLQKLLITGKKFYDGKEYNEAYNYFSQGAALKSPEAQYYLGLCYLNGHGVALSLSEGAMWMESAAQANYIDAQYILALLYMRGLPEVQNVTGHDLFSSKPITDAQDLKIDNKKACYWAKQAAESGSAEGEALYAHLLLETSQDKSKIDEVIKWYDKSIDQGCPQGYMGKGLLLLKSSKTQDDFKEVARLLGFAAENNLGTAAYTLALMYEMGNGVEINREKAAKLYKQAAELGVRSAQALYGVSLRKGNGVEKNFDEAATWLRRASIRGDIEAASVLGDMLAFGDENKSPNYIEAAKWYHFAVEKGGHVGAAVALGNFFLNGLGVIKSRDRAIQLFIFAAEKNYLPALILLTDLAVTHPELISLEKVVQDYLRPQAEKGNKEIMLKLALSLLQCYNLNKNIERLSEAKKWLKICSQEDKVAQYWYGRLLIQEIAKEKNLKEGCKWIKFSAEQGYVEAQLLWASLLLEGATDIGKICADEAIAFFYKAAQQGSASGMFSLGAIYGGGNHVQENRVEAQKWFKKSAELGNSKAQLMLGRYLSKGLAGEKDVDKACYWFIKAKKAGEKEAEIELNALNGLLQAEDKKNIANQVNNKEENQKSGQVEVAPGLFIFEEK